MELDMKDIAIIDALPVYNCEKAILNIGCGYGKIDFHLARMGYRIYATDIKHHNTWQDKERLSFHTSNIFDLTSFPISSIPIVICSQVLEHLRDYKKALANLLTLTEIRLIMTFPYKRSFRSPGHVNFWDEENIGEFTELCKPYFVSLSKIVTKSKDRASGHRDYLMIIDKRQKEA